MIFVRLCRLGACPGIDVDPTNNNNSLCFVQYELFTAMQKCGEAGKVHDDGPSKPTKHRHGVSDWDI